MTERIKELREWATFVLTLATLVAVPSVALILRDQRLQIENAASQKFVTQETFRDFQSETNRKLDTISGNVSAMQQDLALIKGRLEHPRSNP